MSETVPMTHPDYVDGANVPKDVVPLWEAAGWVVCPIQPVKDPVKGKSK